MNTDIVLHKPIRELNQPELKEALVRLITTIYRIAGYELKAEDCAFQVNELLKDVSNSHMTLETLSEVMIKGVKGQFGDWHGLSVMTYHKWIAAYKAIKPVNQVKALPQKVDLPLTKEEREQVFRDSLEWSRQHFYRTGELLDVGNKLFDGCWNRGIINFDEAQAKIYKDDAFARISHEQETRLKSAKERIDKIAVNQIMEEIARTFEEDSLVKIEAKKLALADYFKQTKQ